MASRRTALAVAAMALGAAALAGCDDISTIQQRPGSPVVLTGAQLPDLVGEDPDQIVAFSFTRIGDAPGVWAHIPVQIDERRVVDFGSQPANKWFMMPVPLVSVRNWDRKPIRPRVGIRNSSRTRPLP